VSKRQKKTQTLTNPRRHCPVWSSLGFGVWDLGFLSSCIAIMKHPLARMHHSLSSANASACADSLGARRLRRGHPDKVGPIGRIAPERVCGRCGLAFFAVLALAACASTPPKDHPAATPPPTANDCHCDDAAADELHGFAFMGRIVAVQADQGVVLIAFHEIPGALPAGTREFKAAPQALAAVQPGRDILGRIEQRNGEWWLFDVRLLVPLPAASNE
jgi:hypothetical protein